MKIPLTVHDTNEYIKNFKEMTKGTGRLMLFAGDQRIEHLNKDFYGKGIHPDDSSPAHLFNIAHHAKVGAFATQLGLISKYGMHYDKTNYLVKLNSKTDLIPKKQMDPYSELLVDVKQVVEFKKMTRLKIVGIGYTIYLGSEFEADMLRTASQVILEAHKEGLVTVIWIYPRGEAIKNEKDPKLAADAAALACCLGADFVKITYPGNKKAMANSVVAAGRTGVLCAGGSTTDKKKFLKTLKDQIDAGARGNATGRNIHQKSLKEAIKLCNAIYSITVERKSLKEAYNLL